MSMQAVILCGGRGIIDPVSRRRVPKGMLHIGPYPVLWHVMKSLSTVGITRFVLALGQGGELIRDYFLKARYFARDFELSLADEKVRFLETIPEEEWSIKFVDTGAEAQTGARVARCKRHLEGGPFVICYSDCLANVDMQREESFHMEQGKTLTLLGVCPPSRLVTILTERDVPVGFQRQTRLSAVGGRISGGYMIAESRLFDRLEPFSECSLEREVMETLVSDRELSVFAHDGFWYAVDTERDLEVLSRFYEQNQRPWLTQPQ